MATQSSHIGSLVLLLDDLPVRTNPTSGNITNLSSLAAVASKVGFKTDSISFGKIILWLNSFVLDGDDVLRRSSLKSSDKESALNTYRGLTGAFRFPFKQEQHERFCSNFLTTERRSFLSLLDQFLQKEHPIFIPEIEEISEVIEKLRSLIQEFEELELPEYIKRDFAEQIELYIRVANHLPMVAHRLLANESSNLLSWLFSSLPDNAKKTVSKAAVTVNLLAAAFIAPAESADAAKTYYKWYSETFAQPQQISTVVAPKALPKPSKGGS
ncbi:hypothetical protein ACFCW2_13255 [Qipengyuania sp. DSG2-2]|uniref:hypothetical protein n=1 Tax=Qipengyuania sp. DGS2-2 TaxID=3349631 RepID=UPI0036D23571